MSKKQKLHRSLSRRLGRLEKGLILKEKALLQCQKYPEIEHQADLLKTNFSKLRPRMKTLDCEDWQQGGASCTLILDPELTPKEQLEHFYRHARKLKRGIEPLKKIIGSLQKEKQRIATAFATLEEASPEELDVLENEFLQKRPPKKEALFKSPSFHTFYSASGLALLVGKDGKSNLHITFQCAKKGDLWFHNRNGAGAHVIIRKGQKKEIDQEALLDAASLALYFSKARASLGQEHEVVVAEKQHVRRMKDAPAGKVLLSKYKTLRVLLDPGRIEAIKNRPPLIK
jgi:predicted ribosome quality control (RQC) complex YloA/Tae2 family protein